ncbi:MAG TPA: VCBS repeat-containing protein, partial [Candidatus Paceibacterota bacterium]|nr:VCBS repeat-containing protein [Candidatus Paceibacterota bacterium]
ALLLTSPAINAGDSSGAPAFDQRGSNRVVCGAMDIGAFEFQDVQPPEVSTLPTDLVTFDSARLEGEVSPSGLETMAWFEWRTEANGAYAYPTSVTNVGGGISVVGVSYLLLLQEGLRPGVVHHYRLVASNCAGTVAGGDRVFTPPLTTPATNDLPGVFKGAVAWGDYDNDDDLDLVFTGMSASEGPIARVYRNMGGGVLVIETNALLPGVMSSAVAWGDYDNDGDLDLLLTGSTNGQDNALISHLYRNDGGTNFVQVDAGLPGVRNGSAAWGHFDNDGWLDLLLTGSTNGQDSGSICLLCRNQGGTNFVRIEAGLAGVQDSAVACGDYDNDGNLDLALTGTSAAGSRVARLYRNHGQSAFTWNTDAVLPAVRYSSVAWGDYDQDGDLDLLLTGSSTTGKTACIYRNNGNDIFIWNTNAALPGVFRGTGAWGDCDNDGDLDLLVAGEGEGSRLAQVFRNDGAGAFAEIRADLPGVLDTAAAWGDVDNDGDLDLLLTGDISSSAGICVILQNHTTYTNTPPEAPTSLTTSLLPEGARLGWQPAADAQTSGSGLTYNLRVGTAPGGCDVVSPQANPANGFRRVPQLGNVQHRLFAVLANLQAGTTYYWSVQAVDTAFAGGPFAEEQSFVAGTPEPPLILSLTALPGPTFRLDGLGAPGLLHTLLISTNLAEWVAGATNAAGSDGSLKFLDTPPPNWPACFYRLRCP